MISLCRHGWWGGEEGDGQATRWSQLCQSQACHTGHIEEDKVRHFHKSFSLSSFALTLWLSDNEGDIWIVFLACLLVWRLDSAHQGSWSRANKSNSVVERNIINLWTWNQPFRSASIKLYFAIFSLFYALQINSYLLSRTTRIIGQFPDTDTKRWCHPKQKLSFGHSGHLRPATQ